MPFSYEDAVNKGISSGEQRMSRARGRPKWKKRQKFFYTPENFLAYKAEEMAKRRLPPRNDRRGDARIRDSARSYVKREELTKANFSLRSQQVEKRINR